jgi:hypothetical protein
MCMGTHINVYRLNFDKKLVKLKQIADTMG